MNVNHDFDRYKRTGIPEAILAEPKEITDIIIAINSIMKKSNQALITRITKTQIHHIIEHINLNGWKYECDSFSRTMIIHSDIIEKPKNELSVAIFSGGTSDRFIVEEIIMCVRFFGYSCKSYQDIGVAGYHRFQPALEEVENNINIKCLIIVAGQEGALFPVISGQTRLPIIAVPSPVGYGYKGGGESALITALQTCAPGIGVVNIANGFGAAALASKILNLFNLS